MKLSGSDAKAWMPFDTLAREVEGFEFWGLGFRVEGFKFWGLGFRLYLGTRKTGRG